MAYNSGDLQTILHFSRVGFTTTVNILDAPPEEIEEELELSRPSGGLGLSSAGVPGMNGPAADPGFQKQSQGAASSSSKE